MNEKHRWHPAFKTWFRWRVVRLTWSNFSGAAYQYAREKGKVMRFWTLEEAQAYADKKNIEAES